MAIERGGGPYGINPVLYWSTGTKSFGTGMQGPVYYSTGSGSMPNQWEYLDAVCRTAFFAPAE